MATHSEIIITVLPFVILPETQGWKETDERHNHVGTSVKRWAFDISLIAPRSSVPFWLPCLSELRRRNIMYIFTALSSSVVWAIKDLLSFDRLRNDNNIVAHLSRIERHGCVLFVQRSVWTMSSYSISKLGYKQDKLSYSNRLFQYAYSVGNLVKYCFYFKNVIQHAYEDKITIPYSFLIVWNIKCLCFIALEGDSSSFSLFLWSGLILWIDRRV